MMRNPFRLAPADLGFKAGLRQALVDESYLRARLGVLCFLPILYALYLVLEEACRRRPDLYWAFGAVVATLLLQLATAFFARWINGQFPNPRLQQGIFALSPTLTGLGLALICLWAAPFIGPSQRVLLAILTLGTGALAILSLGPSLFTYLCFMTPILASVLLVLVKGPRMEQGRLFGSLILAGQIVLIFVAAYVHILLRKSVLLELKLKEMILRDSLTLLRNRRYLTEFMQEETASILRSWSVATGSAKDTASILKSLNTTAGSAEPRSLGFIMMDMDHFNSVNDTHGQEAGDAVLVQVASRLKATARKPDLLIRWGGEKFVIVARETNRTPPFRLAERLRQAMEAREFSLPSGERVHLTCCCGYSVYPFSGSQGDVLSWEQVLGMADVALAEAKERGPNHMTGISIDDKGKDRLKAIPLAVEQDLKQAERDGLIRVTPTALKP